MIIKLKYKRIQSKNHQTEPQRVERKKLNHSERTLRNLHSNRATDDKDCRAQGNYSIHFPWTTLEPFLFHHKLAAKRWWKVLQSETNYWVHFRYSPLHLYSIAVKSWNNWWNGSSGKRITKFISSEHQWNPFISSSFQPGRGSVTETCIRYFLGIETN